MNSLDQFIGGWNYQTQILAQSKDQNNLELWIKPQKLKSKNPLRNKKHTLVNIQIQPPSSNTIQTIESNDNKTQEFLSSIRQRKTSKKLDLIPQIQNIQGSKDLQRSQKMLLKTQQPLLFQQIGKKKDTIKKQFQENNIKNYPLIPMNTLSTTLYRCFNKGEKTKYLLCKSQRKNNKQDKDQYMFKNSNLQKILKLREKLRRKNHSQVQKIKLLSHESYSVPKNRKNIQHFPEKSINYELEVKPSKSNSVNQHYQYNIYKQKKQLQILKAKTQKYFYKQPLQIRQNKGAKTPNIGRSKKIFQLMQRTLYF